LSDSVIPLVMYVCIHVVRSFFITVYLFV